ncbi:hypothetical protein FHS35_009130 [Streptomyces umbrinus]|uniref:hypothetical protein n=1 Tax=Streptomyces umbrinus TaxID=67370 RepID=UPI00167CED18|nr:hypothetical protein [Streptomyces umbrinus]MCR3732212.1 hypothetical protein [Streptomyces umbrinus]GHH68484.1 hypothetical protein GCM10018775_93040 [Streptomyces umbrinus]
MPETNRVTPVLAAQSLAMRPLFSRSTWERALLASTLPANAKAVGLALAHLAGDAGYIPPGRIHGTRPMATLVSLRPRLVSISKGVLQGQGFITRPPAEGWTGEVSRPITLTLPPERQEPAHTGEQP